MKIRGIVLITPTSSTSFLHPPLFPRLQSSPFIPIRKTPFCSHHHTKPKKKKIPLELLPPSFLTRKMAAMQHSPVTFQARSPLSAAKILSNKPLNLSFSGTFSSFKLTNKVVGKSRSGASSARMSATAAGSYATALADVAKSNGTLDSTADDVEKIEKLFSDEQVLDFFCNPTVDVEKKRNVLDEIARTSSIQPHTTNFLNILVDMKRIDLIKDIAKEFELVYNQLTDTELAVVSSVVKLESDHLAQIAKQVQKLSGAKNVRIKTAIDTSLVAGFTIRYGSGGSKLIDMSVKKQLQEIADELDMGNIQLA